MPGLLFPSNNYKLSLVKVSRHFVGHQMMTGVASEQSSLRLLAMTDLSIREYKECKKMLASRIFIQRRYVQIENISAQVIHVLYAGIKLFQALSTPMR